MALRKILMAVVVSFGLLATACSSKRDSDNEFTSAKIGVNAFLWRASLDTFEFMPLESADPRGGLIITDWYSSPDVPTERFKATIYILDTRLRADGINVSLYKQVKNGNDWVDANTDPDTEIQLENAILTRARQLKVGNFS